MCVRVCVRWLVRSPAPQNARATLCIIFPFSIRATGSGGHIPFHIIDGRSPSVSQRDATEFIEFYFFPLLFSVEFFLLVMEYVVTLRIKEM